MKKVKTILICSVVFIALVIGFIGARYLILTSIFSKTNTTANIASDFKKLDLNDEYLIIRTLSQDSTGFGTWLSWNKPGSGYALNLSSNQITKVNSIKGVAGRDIVILGKYNDYIYIYQTNKGINKIKDGKSYNIISYPTPTFRLLDDYLLYSIGEYNSDNNTRSNTIYLMNLNDENTTIIYEYSSNEYNNEYGSAQDYQIIDNNMIAIQILAAGGDQLVQLYDFNGTIIGLVASDSRSISTSYNRQYILTTDWIDDEYFASCYEIKTRKKTRITKYEYYHLLYNIDENIMVGNVGLLDIISRYGTPVEKDKDLTSVLFDTSDKIFFRSDDWNRVYSVDKRTGEKTELFDADKYNERIDDVYIISR